MKLFTARRTMRALHLRPAFGALLCLACGACVPKRPASELETAVVHAPPPTAHPTPKRVAAKPKPRAQQKKLAAWARGKTVKQVLLPPNVRAIALTFDDGPWPVYTRRILKTLRDEKVSATFYVLGSNVKNYPDITRAIHRDGHDIGSHSWSHPIRTRHAVMEIDRTDAIIKRTVGVETLTFRPPYGIMRNGLADVAKKRGKAVVLWSADSMDWRHATVSSILSRLNRECGRGGIALMHDGGGDRRATADALPILIANLRARGFRFVTVPQLLALRLAPFPRPNPKYKRFHFGPLPKKLSKRLARPHR